MSDTGEAARVLFLNRDDQWPQFERHHLELAADGTLCLATLPLLPGAQPAALATRAAATAPGGICLGPGGVVYFTSAGTHRLWRVDPCDPTLEPLPCLGGEGVLPTQLLEPRGVAWHPTLDALIVVDSGNHRLQLFAPRTRQLRGVWGQPDAAAAPTASDAPGRFATPWGVAVGPDGHVYVADHGNRRVQELDAFGRVVPAFWETLRRQAPLQQPSEVAVLVRGAAVEVYVLDPAASSVFVCDRGGRLLRTFERSIPRAAIGLAVAEDGLYVGDNGTRRVLKFTLDGARVGAARGYDGPVAALAPDDGALLVHGGGAEPPLRLDRRGACVTRGWLWGGPFHNPSARTQPWHLLKAVLAPLVAGCHVQLAVASVAPAAAAPPAPTAGGEFADPPWRRFALDAMQGIVAGQPLDSVWVGVQLTSDGLHNPVLSQLRIDFDHDSYVTDLPAIYRGDAQSLAFLTRFLSLFQSLFTDLEDGIGNLQLLFDPAAVPLRQLGWLAGWLGIELDESWPERRRREFLASAFARGAWRGTARGLRESLRVEAGVDAHIEEPILESAWWVLADAASSASSPAVLGVTTMLAASEPQGAVVGTTATLDRADLSSEEEFGAPLFTETAHQFLVRVYPGQVAAPERRRAAQQVLDREAPAHCAYHLCVVEPRMRVGFQARLGVDTIVATSGSSHHGLVLGGDPPGRIGPRSSVGISTRLGDAPAPRG